MAGDFAADVEQWVLKSEPLIEGVFHESTQRVFDAMTTPRDQGGNLPVDTGYLWHSAQASTSAPPPINSGSIGNPGQKYTLDSGPIELIINGAELGQTVYACFTASYARHVNYGTKNQSAALFVEQAVQRWAQIVSEVQMDLKGRMTAAQ